MRWCGAVLEVDGVVIRVGCESTRSCSAHIKMAGHEQGSPPFRNASVWASELATSDRPKAANDDLVSTATFSSAEKNPIDD